MKNSVSQTSAVWFVVCLHWCLRNAGLQSTESSNTVTSRIQFVMFSDIKMVFIHLIFCPVASVWCDLILTTAWLYYFIFSVKQCWDMNEFFIYFHFWPLEFARGPVGVLRLHFENHLWIQNNSVFNLNLKHNVELKTGTTANMTANICTGRAHFTHRTLICVRKPDSKSHL